MGSYGSVVIINALRKHQESFPFGENLGKIAILKAEISSLNKKKGSSERLNDLEKKLLESYKELADEATKKSIGK